MRSVLVFALVTACGGSEEECARIQVPFGTSMCAEGGLEGVDVGGTWVVTGTKTVARSTGTTTENIVEPAEVVARCERRDASPQYRSCSLDDTIAACNLVDLHHRTEVVSLACRDAGGIMHWHSTTHAFWTGVEVWVEVIGTLSRPE